MFLVCSLEMTGADLNPAWGARVKLRGQGGQEHQDWEATLRLIREEGLGRTTNQLE